MPDSQTLLLIFVAFTGAAVVLQAGVLFALFLTIRKTTQALTKEVANLHTAALPMIDSSREFLNRVGPKIEVVTTDLMEMTQSLRAKTEGVQGSTLEALQRVQVQAGRLDGLLTRLFDGADRVGDVMHNVVAVPMRQASAVAAALKAVLNSLRAKPEASEAGETREPVAAVDTQAD